MKSSTIGQQKESKRTICIAIDGCWNQMCPIIVFFHYKCGFDFLISFGRGRTSFYKMFVHVCVTTKCGAHDKSHPAKYYYKMIVRQKPKSI
jgi:hypothetical protein